MFTFNVLTVCLSIVQACGFVEIPATISRVRRCCSCADVATTGLPQLGCVTADAAEAPPPELKALEFYSGIGGLRMSLEKAAEETTGLKANVRSYEINEVANSLIVPLIGCKIRVACLEYASSYEYADTYDVVDQGWGGHNSTGHRTHRRTVYEHNFPGCTVTRRSIEHLSSQDLDGAADIWLLRIGKQMDEDDNRSVSFLHLLSILKAAEEPPDCFFLENVKGFEGSHAHQRLLEVLTLRGFRVEQYLLSPIQLGIPNTRLRYFCLAWRGGVEGGGEICPIQESLPWHPSAMPSSSTERVPGQEEKVNLRPLSEYLDQSMAGEAAVPLLLSPKAASYANPSLRFDVATQQSTETTTFTKGYGKHAGRAGPVLLLTGDGERRVSEEDLGRFPSGLDLGPQGRELRWFSDREMLRLHGFPERFEFPAGLSLRQRFALVGNSVNVEVVALLLRRLLLLRARVERDALVGEKVERGA